MRIDKFLKVSRILKRRSVANLACQSEKVFVFDKLVKPSYKLKIGDEVKIIFGENVVKFIVKSLNEKASRQEADSLYEIIQS